MNKKRNHFCSLSFSNDECQSARNLFKAPWESLKINALFVRLKLFESLGEFFLSKLTIPVQQKGNGLFKD